MTKAREAALEAADLLEHAQKNSKSTLPQIKAELRTALESFVTNKKQSILIVVDDIDRLAPDEIRLVFQLIRANSDFPGLVFLLLYDPPRVFNALNPVFGEDSYHFIEKIVQFQIRLPTLSEAFLEKYILEEVRKIAANHPGSAEMCDPARFHDLWSEGLQTYITNLRRADRLVSSYKFHLALFQSKELEVNPLDMLVIEAFRLFEPAVYEGIRSPGSTVLYDPTIHWQAGSDEEKLASWHSELETLVNSTKPIFKFAALSLLKQLFPSGPAALDPFANLNRLTYRVQERRVCSTHFFHRYFRFSIECNDVSEQQVTELQMSLLQSASFQSRYEALKSAGLAAVALTKLLCRESLSPSEDPMKMIPLIIQIGESNLADTNRDHFYISIESAMVNLLEVQLPRELSQDERFHRLLQGITSSNSLHFPIQVVFNEEVRIRHSKKGEAKDPDSVRPHVSDSHIEILKKLVCDRLEAAIQSGQACISEPWQQSLHWYFNIAERTTEARSDIILSRPETIALTLITAISDQLIEHFKVDPNPKSMHPIQKVDQWLGHKRFMAAAHQHRAALESFGQSVQTRFRLYHEMDKLFSNEAAPKGANAPSLRGTEEAPADGDSGYRPESPL